MKQKFNNYVFMTICEIMVNKFNDSTFSNFLVFNHHHKLLVNDIKLNRYISNSDYNKIQELLNLVIVELNLIFNLSSDETLVFFLEFYELDNNILNAMNKAITLNKALFPFIGC